MSACMRVCVRACVCVYFNVYILKDGRKKDRMFRKPHKLGLIQLLSGVVSKISRDTWALSKIILCLC